MATEMDIYTGKIKYRDVDFEFVFDGAELRLVPPLEKKEEIHMEWIMTPMGNGGYTMGEPLKMESSYLVGKCNENGRTLIFITQQGANIGSSNSVLFVEIVGYIVCKYDRKNIDRISFSSPEINCIHPTNQAYQYTFNEDSFSQKGVFSLTTKDFDSTTTEKQDFKVDDKNVQMQFCVSRRISNKIGEAPVTLNSSMIFEFEPTDDFMFILKLWYIAKQFIQFLCYRKNVFLPEAELSAPYEGGKHEKFAVLYVLNESGCSEIDTLKKGCYIKQKYIAGFEGKILTDIAANLLCIRHLPDTYKSGRHIDAARFIMITAAFEWEFHRAYPNGVPKKDSTIKVEKEASEAIQELIESSSGKLKKKYQFLKKLIKSDSLQNEIIRIGEDFDGVIGNFGKHLYSLNGENLIYSEMGKRLADQRNHFAHGDLDKDFIGLSLLDLIYMEYIIYAMQLRSYGVGDEDIQKAINELFHLNYAL